MSFKPGSRIEYRNGIWECDGFATDVWINDIELAHMGAGDAGDMLRDKMVRELAEMLIKQKVVIINKERDPEHMRYRVTAELNVLRKC